MISLLGPLKAAILLLDRWVNSSRISRKMAPRSGHLNPHAPKPVPLRERRRRTGRFIPGEIRLVRTSQNPSHFLIYDLSMRPFPNRGLMGFLSVAALLSGCVGVKPVSMDTDPNQQRYREVHDKMEENDVEAFIAAHPDLDEESKDALRKRTLSRSDAQKRLKTPAR